MTAVRSVPSAPVGQQGPPARAAASDSGGSRRVARGPLLLTTGTDCPRKPQGPRQDPQCWLEGYRAGRLGLRNSSGPYAPGTTEAWSWISGYIEGKATRRAGTRPMLDDHREY